MTKSSRVFIKNRTNRRVRNMSYSGLNKRKGIGRRKQERYAYYILISTLATITALAVIIIAYCYWHLTK